MRKTLTMKELPERERPYEKCMEYGPEALSDAELIGVIIRTGSQGEKSTDLANRILAAAPNGLLNLIYMNMDDLQQIRGIGSVKAVQLKCIGELAKRIAASSRFQGNTFQCSEEIAMYYMERMRHEPKEHLFQLMFDRKNMVLGESLISVGTSNASLVSAKEIFQEGLRNHAEYIVILHNHPSGDPTPSQEDVSVTYSIQKCGDLLGIILMDHIIIGDNCYFSFRENGLLTGKEE